MPKNIPSLKPRQLIRLLKQTGVQFYREGKGDHSLYFRHVDEKKRVGPIDMGIQEFSPPYVLRILRQLGFTDEEINKHIKIEDKLQDNLRKKSGKWNGVSEVRKWRDMKF